MKPWDGLCVRKGCANRAAEREIVCAPHAAARDWASGRPSLPEFMAKNRLIPGIDDRLGKHHRSETPVFCMANAPWSPQEKSNLRRWILDENLSIAEIMKRTGRTELAIDGKANRMGLHWAKGARTPYWVQQRING